MCGDEVFLGYTYYLNGEKLNKPLKEKPSHYEEIDKPQEIEETDSVEENEDNKE